LELNEVLPDPIMDVERVTQVVNNLLTNAVKFSHPNTCVTLGARRDGENIQLWVRDEGVGIPEKEMAGLFSFFGQTSARPTGGEFSTGLGLAIAKKIVEAHGGSIQAESSPGVGSCFTVRIPIG
jgi:signal transduction histidine kinase